MASGEAARSCVYRQRIHRGNQGRAGCGGIANEVVPIPFNITLLKFGNETILFDAGTGGQFQPTAGAMIANMAAAGIKPSRSRG